MPKRLQGMFKKLRSYSGKEKNFLSKIFLMDMFLLAGGIQFEPPYPEWYNEKSKKCFLDVRKKSEKVKILSKLFFQLPIWS